MVNDKFITEYLQDLVFKAMGETPLAYYFIYYRKINGKIKSVTK